MYICFWMSTHILSFLCKEKVIKKWLKCEIDLVCLRCFRGGTFPQVPEKQICEVQWFSLTGAINQSFLRNVETLDWRCVVSQLLLTGTHQCFTASVSLCFSGWSHEDASLTARKCLSREKLRLQFLFSASAFGSLYRKLLEQLEQLDRE